MKKLFTVVAMLAIVAAVVSGCKQEEKAPTPPEVPSTNAPAAK